MTNSSCRSISCSPPKRGLKNHQLHVLQFLPQASDHQDQPSDCSEPHESDLDAARTCKFAGLDGRRRGSLESQKVEWLVRSCAWQESRRFIPTHPNIRRRIGMSTMITMTATMARTLRERTGFPEKAVARSATSVSNSAPNTTLRLLAREIRLPRRDQSAHS